MKNYRIRVNAIDSTYKANSEKEALEKYAKDAGYASYADLTSQHGEVDSADEIVPGRN